MIEVKRDPEPDPGDKLTDEERHEHEQIERNARRHPPVANAEMEIWRKAGEKALDDKRKRISIMVRERDLEKLKAKAAKLGMPYQTLINSILHQYAEAD